MSNLPEVLSDDLCLALDVLFLRWERIRAYGIIFPITPQAYREGKCLA